MYRIPDDHPNPVMDLIFDELVQVHPEPVTGWALVKKTGHTAGRIYPRLASLELYHLIESVAPGDPRRAKPAPYRLTRQGLTLAQRPEIRCRVYRFTTGWSRLTVVRVAILRSALRRPGGVFTVYSPCEDFPEYDFNPCTIRHAVRELRDWGIVATESLPPGHPRARTHPPVHGHRLTEEGLRLAVWCNEGLELDNYAMS